MGERIRILPRPPLGRSRNAKRRRILLLPYPGLRPADKREADETPDIQGFPAVLRLHFDAVNFARFRIEDFTAAILVALLREAPHNRHAQDGLIAPGAGAF